MATEQQTMDWPGRIFIGLLKFFSWFSLPLNHRLGAAIGYVLWWLPESVSNPKRISRINLETAFPEMSDLDRRRLLKSSLVELGKTSTELGPLWLWNKQRVLALIQQVSGQALLDDAIARNQGVIMLCPHLGAWEVIAPYLTERYSTTYLYRPPNLPSIENFMLEVRGRFGAKLAPTDRKGVMMLIKALKRNELVGILPDQDPGKNGGIYAPFYQHPARTMTLVSKLASKTNCALLFISAERLPHGQGYHLQILPADSCIADGDETVAASALNAGIESLIETVNPVQYQWNYKRYKHPPAGVKDVYKK